MHQNHLSYSVVALTACLLAVPATVRAQPPPDCIAATSQTFLATGGLQTYSVPPGATALLITANGASGGRGEANGTFTALSQGVHLQAGIPVSGLSSLDVVVGSSGGDWVLGSSGSGGGGGGSFVFTAAGTPLVAAGGGGGGFFSVAGADAQLGQTGGSGGGPNGGAGGTGGSGGAGGTQPGMDNNGGGGGGFLSPGGDGANLPYSGKGGHRISPPGDAAGGAGSARGIPVGGFGGGGGSASSAGGGGGGFSGGGGGGFSEGGGGGSFVAAGGTTYASSVSNTGDGTVTICATAIQPDDKQMSELGPGVSITPQGNSCGGGVAWDDGSFENGYRIANAPDTRFVQLLTPTSYPSLLSQVCACFDTFPGSDSFNISFVLYDNSGPGGQPGRFLGSVPGAISTSSASTPTFTSASCASLNLALGSGAVYVGAQWDDAATTGDLFICGDETSTTPLATMYSSSNAAGSWQSVTSSHPTARALGLRAQFTAATGCIPNDTAMCLNNGRFKVTATFDAGSSGSGDAHVVKLTGDTGYLWFFNGSNVEAVIKVLNACSFGYYWVFAGGLTNVKVEITVTDTQTMTVKTYRNPPSTAFQPIQDTSAFPTCP
jgi:hypothetical protein